MTIFVFVWADLNKYSAHYWSRCSTCPSPDCAAAGRVYSQTLPRLHLWKTHVAASAIRSRPLFFLPSFSSFCESLIMANSAYSLFLSSLAHRSCIWILIFKCGCGFRFAVYECVCGAAAMARSFLQVAATEEVATPLRVVQIEGLVISSFPFSCFASNLILKCRD